MLNEVELLTCVAYSVVGVSRNNSVPNTHLHSADIFLACASVAGL
jgi:hypothetical protein